MSAEERLLSFPWSSLPWYLAAPAHRPPWIRAERLGWTQSDLALRLKGDPAKLPIASRLRSETILPMTWIARRLHLGTAKSARPRLRT